MNLTKYIAQGAMLLIGVVSILLVILGYYYESGDANADVAKAAGSWTGMIIYWTIGVFSLGLVGAVISSVVAALSDTSNLLKTVIVFVGAVALVGICWSLADGTPLPLVGYNGSENVPVWLKIADTGLFLGYISAVVAVVSIVVSEVIQLFR